MRQPVNITLEGFTIAAAPDEFEGAAILVKPAVIYTHQSLSELIADYCIDVSLGIEQEEEEGETRRRLQNAFYKVRKKSTPNRQYFRWVVEIYPYSDEAREVYRVIEWEGRGHGA